MTLPKPLAMIIWFILKSKLLLTYGIQSNSSAEAIEIVEQTHSSLVHFRAKTLTIHTRAKMDTSSDGKRAEKYAIQ